MNVGVIALDPDATAVAEMEQPLRRLNLVLGVWALTLAWMLSTGGHAARWDELLLGVVLLLACRPRR